MTITLLETQVYEGKEIVAVHTFGSCKGCIGFSIECGDLPPCSPPARGGSSAVIWMYTEDALKARLRGEIR
jgi:hypothetical protein